MAVKKWVAKVQTESTFPEEHLFNQDATTIAKHMASKKVSPKGPASGMRMLNYYVNRGGKNLSKERHAELEKAKHILSRIIADKKGEVPAKKCSEEVRCQEGRGEEDGEESLDQDGTHEAEG